VGVDLAAVVVRARERAKGIRTVQTEWVLKEVLPRESRQEQDLHSVHYLRKWPPEDLELEHQLTLILDGRDFFEGWRGQVLQPAELRFEPYQRGEVFLDDVSYRWNPPDGGGTVGRDGPGAKGMVEAYPFFMAYRLFDPVLGYLRREEIRSPGAAERKGHPCVLVEEHREGESRPVGQWWLARDMDYCPVHVEWQFGEAIGDQFDLRYAPDEEAGWRLQSWDWERPANGFDRLGPWRMSGESVDTKINEPVDPAIFEVPSSVPASLP
jgi:hypothetical protein